MLLGIGYWELGSQPRGEVVPDSRDWVLRKILTIFLVSLVSLIPLMFLISLITAYLQGYSLPLALIFDQDNL
ncbi:hypothetical protein Nos7524_4496 [Nostoc sp. PCC 7524]|nr:hypothetical protein Nos7524_4496 [Nostoc sp. PCC 7524]